MSISTSFDFWRNPDVVNAYRNGGNATQIKRFYQANQWLTKNPIKPGELLVDVGAGTAEISLLFAMCLASGNVLAVDYSPAMVMAAQMNKRALGLPNINIWNSDAMNLSLPANEASVDRLISFTAIHWFNDIEKFLNGVHKYLKPGGLFFFRYAGCQGDQTLEAAEKLRKEDKWVSRFEGFNNPMYTHSIDKMQAIIRKVNLVCEKAAIWENIEHFNNREDYKKYVEGWLPHLYFLTDEQDRQEFLDEIVERHCNNPNHHSKDNTIIVFDTQVEVWGYKPEVKEGVEPLNMGNVLKIEPGTIHPKQIEAATQSFFHRIKSPFSNLVS